MLSRPDSSMVMHEPGILVIAYHGNMAVDSTSVLINYVAGDFRTFIIEFFIQAVKAFLLVNYMSVFFRVDKAGLKEKIPESIKVNITGTDV